MGSIPGTPSGGSSPIATRVSTARSPTVNARSSVSLAAGSPKAASGGRQSSLIVHSQGSSQQLNQQAPEFILSGDSDSSRSEHDRQSLIEKAQRRAKRRHLREAERWN